MTHQRDGDELQPLDQTATRCKILGIDDQGAEHVYDPDRERVVALGPDGIHVQYDITPEQKSTWMAYVSSERGWAHEQWLGWRLKGVLFGSK